EILQDAVFRLLRRSLGVGVLDAEDQRPVVAASEQPVEERGARVADVQLAGGTWRESQSHLLSEGLRPSDSPTRALARRFAGSLPLRGSLALARSPPWEPTICTAAVIVTGGS